MKITEKVAKRATLGLLGGIVGFLGLNAASIPVVSAINERLSDDQSTVVFTSGYDPLPLPSGMISGVQSFFMYTPVTLRQNLKGRHVDWVKNASRDEVLEALADPTYDNVVMIGHGASNIYAASDGDVTAEDIRQEGISQRRGEFIQHTCCRDQGGESLYEAIFSEGSQAIRPEGVISVLGNYLSAWTNLGR